MPRLRRPPDFVFTWPQGKAPAVYATSERHKRGGRVDWRDLPRGPRGFALCRWCDKECDGPRKTFCSDACVYSHCCVTRSSVLRDEVWRRDRGFCQNPDCKAPNTVMVAELIRDGAATREQFGVPPRRKLWARKWGGGLWDCDHVVACQFNGGHATPDMCQTLCIPCHKDKTRLEAIVRRDERRALGFG
jgi:5-methylcytosine-specific restriction endonuclease McrA